LHDPPEKCQRSRRLEARKNKQMLFQSAGRTDVGLKRKLNEDSILEIPEAGFWVVADGMGGHEAGEVASAMVAEELSKIARDIHAGNCAEVVVATLKDVNNRLIELAHQGGSKQTIGSTVVALVIRDGVYHCFWAGDSRAYLVRKRKITQITRDHSLVQDLMSAGLVSEEEAKTHPDANVITRAIGATSSVEIDSVSGEVHANDTFLLATDGLTRCVEDNEILIELTTRNPHQAIAKMSDMTLARGAPDNFSIIAIRVV
jgi:serine/threonine protein phosphatase PrpC